MNATMVSPSSSFNVPAISAERKQYLDRIVDAVKKKFSETDKNSVMFDVVGEQMLAPPYWLQVFGTPVQSYATDPEGVDLIRLLNEQGFKAQLFHQRGKTTWPTAFHFVVERFDIPEAA